jgi:hypothetical protein
LSQGTKAFCGSKRNNRALSAAADGTADMGLRSMARATRQNKLRQSGQARVVQGERLIKPKHLMGMQLLIARDAQLAAQIEQVVLDLVHQAVDAPKQFLCCFLKCRGKQCSQDTELRIQLIDLTHRMHPKAVFGGTAAVTESGAPVIAGARGNRCQSLTHKTRPFLAIINR